MKKIILIISLAVITIAVNAQTGLVVQGNTITILNTTVEMDSAYIHWTGVVSISDTLFQANFVTYQDYTFFTGGSGTIRVNEWDIFDQFTCLTTDNQGKDLSLSKLKAKLEIEGFAVTYK